MLKRLSQIAATSLVVFAFAATGHAGVLYAIDDTTNSLVTIDRGTGAVSVIGSTLVPSGDRGDLAYDPIRGMMYWTPGGASRSVYRLNLATGAASFHFLSNATNVAGLAFDSVNDILYGASVDGGVDECCNFAPFIGAGSFRLFNAIGEGGWAMEYRADTDTVYWLSETASLWKTDRTTGISTRVAINLGAPHPGYGDLAWDSEFQAWWVVDQSGAIYRYNADWTSRTLVATYGHALDGLAFVPSPAAAAPEPASLALLGIALLGLRLTRRRR